MKFKVVIPVRQDIEKVKSQFTSKLLMKLSPPFPIPRLMRYDGNQKGDRVVFSLDFLVFSELWESEIIDFQEREDYFEFVDKGRVLPFFLKSWKHRHILKAEGDKTLIIEDVEFHSGPLLLTLLVFPLVYSLFLYRIPIYKKELNK